MRYKKICIYLYFGFFVCSLLYGSNLYGQDPFIIKDPYPGDKYTTNGVSWGDWNNDGFIDVFLGNGAAGYKFADFLYKNKGDGTFEKITGQSIVTEVHLTGGACWGDFDNDGDLDIYVVLNEDSPTGTDLENILYINNGGTFTKSTIAGPPITEAEYSNTAGWGDYDNDGLLDLFVQNGWQNKREHSLYNNNGGGVFSQIDAGDMTGANGAAFIAGFAWCDFDNDGDLDVFTCGGSGPNNHLWRNDGGSFNETGSFDASSANGCSWADIDNDGDFDLFIANYADGSVKEKNFLYINNGDGTFTKNTTNNITTETSYSIGSAFGDIDNDGDLDLFVANDYQYNSDPNFLFFNNGDGSFTKNTSSVAVTDPTSQAPHGVAFADYNNDGFLDLFAAVHGPNFFLENVEPGNGNTNHWILLNLVGTTSNRSGIGAKIWLKATISGGTKTQLREISSQTGQASHNSLRAHFGLGDATTITEIKVEWPSGTEQILTNVDVDQILTITEGGSSPQITDLDLSITVDDILLEFSPLDGATGYNVYRGTSYDFVPDQSGGSNRIAENINDEDGGTAGVQWTDTGSGADIVGDVSTNYFYRVTGIVTTETDPSNLAGEFDYNLITTGSTDINELVVIMETNDSRNPITTAEELAVAIPNCTDVYYWDASGQGTVGHPKGTPIENFDVKTGYPYIVNVSSPTIWTVGGSYSDVSFTLITTGSTDINHIGVPLSKGTLATAEDLAQDIPNCTDTYYWDASGQGTVGHPKGTPIENFDVDAGYPYYSNVTAETTWPTGGGLSMFGSPEQSKQLRKGVKSGLTGGGVPHTVYGRLETLNGNTLSNSDLQIRSWIASRPGEVLTQEETGVGIDDGYWWVGVSNFSTNWQAGDMLVTEIIDFSTGKNGEMIVELSNNGSDDGGVINFINITGVGENETSVRVTDYVLLPNYPNPFNPSTHIRYGIPESGQVKIQIYDISGRLIKTLVDGERKAGYHEINWDGMNTSGEMVSSGVYVIKLIANNFVSTWKTVKIQ